MDQEVTFERVIDENFDDFVFLLDKMAEYEKHKPTDNQAKNRLKKDAMSENPKFEAYLVRFGGEFIGYILYYMTYSSYLALPVLHLEDLFVLEKFRRKGIGKEMFRFSVQQAKEKGCGRMEWTVYDWNEPSIQFYKKFGASRLDKKYYRFDKGEIEHFLK
ncbi:MAG: GNAT family N-acetyltransferase [Thermoplasmatales archaeon]|nr:MAG: GNAT family N-acetyltransferase [Thermoplasmatales archaeon]